MAINYFTKWAKVEALANIRDVDVKKFVWRNSYKIWGVGLSHICNSIVDPFVSFAGISVSRTSTPPRHILKVMAKLKPPTKQL